MSATTATGEVKVEAKDLALHGIRVAMFVEEKYQDLELHVPYHRLREEGCTVTLLGVDGGKSYNSLSNYPAKADKAIGSASVSDYDALIIPGGYAPDKMRLNPAFAKFTRELYNAGKVVAAICHAPSLLCSAKIITGRRVTSYPSIRDDVENAGGMWQDGEAIVDSDPTHGGTLVTSRTPDDLPAFNRATIAAIKKWKMLQTLSAGAK